MNLAIHGDSSYAAVTVPVKRGRGRPRKDHSLKRVKTANFPPGFKQTKEIRPQQVDTVNVGIIGQPANDGMIGQAVTGVVESAFDAGYLLSVRIGDSNTNFRGVVFKPGHFDPVTAENDVAPHVQMIKRNDIHLPVRNQVQAYGHDRRNVSPPTTAPSVPLVGARGAVVPVVLQPVNPTNGFPPATQAPPDSSQAAHMTVAPLAALPPNGSLTTSQVTQVGDQEALVTAQDGGGSLGEGATLVQQKEVKPIISNNACKPVDIGDMNELPSIGPSDSINSPIPTKITSVTKPLMNYGIGRMTELLQAVQENLMENQVLHAGESSISDEYKS
ncbi:protein METABOLIC NETWORK MODULATOR 1-like isoform X1 [Lycium barbarum]|uniref:protein METABOLIC NETWORK MODULATOR 1-like isoform X1 n=1 Tax=Lycium barbarum TaxID=112863 RepID=UPI00293F387E|nr:protein METABOLIC NETWORK MODULATOR 1-like isoform X1 [Lycium barbarum]XP_060209154.1 protein METABOLIC NETWORK MODULATOR 1-like isoform X1 [Lycium barbarum]XP_060209155.1 protein METABOLIC NETWORK MODULATOR 1-like isoform X1 [Lycium barbarum]XP_060209156.1 protein METABOLIC NETWORK MODULATOR 1-like isoform X1 [Lycium barbarum]XP_060209157.1 protein METABOLIC NETWORK MODULATOR 1-like isoform X1 [Lycium barbarum]